MPPARVLSLAVSFCSFAFIGNSSPAHTVEGGWPEGYEIAEKSESPNGRYAVLVPNRETAEGIDDAAIKNTLVDLKTHRRLAVVRNAHYFSGQNHRDLFVTWAADSSWCAVTFEGRYGFENITLVELHGGKCTQFDVGQHIQKALDAAIAQQGHGDADGGCATAYFRSGTGGQALARAYAFTNPKSLEGQPDYRSLFQGTFDPATGKWTRSDARKILNWDPFEIAYGTSLDEEITFNKEEDRLAWYDAHLNSVYEAVRTVLPPERFAAVKKQEIAWLKQLEARNSIADKCQFIGARIQELRQLVW